MIYSLRIEHIIKGLQENTIETVMRWQVSDKEQNYKTLIKKNMEDAKNKFDKLCSTYTMETFQLVSFNFEKNILYISEGAIEADD